MDKYKSSRHKAYNRIAVKQRYSGKTGHNGRDRGERAVSRYKGTFMLRVNICLSIAVLATVAVRLNNSDVNRVTRQINAELMSDAKGDDFAKLGTLLGFGGYGESTVVLDDEVKERIKEQSTAYQRTQESLRAQASGTP
jgi:hypothetical protein